MTSNLRSARAKARSRWTPGMPSKSRNGCRVTMSRPSSAQALRTSDGVPLKVTRSFSKISTASNLAAAMASSFSSNVPLRETVAIEVFIDFTPGLPFRSLTARPFVERRDGGDAAPVPHCGPTRSGSGNDSGSLPTRWTAACMATM